MANIESAKKRIRQDEVRAERNIQRKNRVRTFVRKLEKAIETNSSDKATLNTLFKSAQSELAKAAGKGVINSRAASRKISRLSARLSK